MFIDGIGISGYRSFRELQEIGPFDKVNLFIGKNNSGKSNILSFINNHYAELVGTLKAGRGSFFNFQEFDQNRDTAKESLGVSLGIKIDGSNYETLLAKSQGDERIRNSIEKILKSKTLAPDGKCSWLEYDPNDSYRLSKKIIENIKDENILDESEWKLIMNKVANISDDSFDKIYHSINALSPAFFDSPEIEIINAKREVQKPEEHTKGYSGENLTENLAELQSPDVAHHHKKAWFHKINKFLKEVTGNDSINIEIPSNKERIIIQENEGSRPLPISSLGTGIGELVIIAYKCTIIENQVICIEEPEIHLHPHAQRKLINYLVNHTNNQYFIATHSAHILDLPNTAIFHVQNTGGQTIVDKVTSDSDKYSICRDLGYRASDLMQANCIIWVEGPSDRIYLNHWINHLCSDFVEGLHYSIMFYGGNLLSHVTADDSEIDEFISLKRLNRNISIFIDSDKSSSTKKINKTKKRIQKEFNEHGSGFAWVTKGCEVENYIEPNILFEAVKGIFKKAKELTSTGQYDKILHYNDEKGEGLDNATKVKVKIAHAVTSHPPNLDVLDLRNKIERLIEFIRESNKQ